MKKQQSGFTLIELVVVIVILGILAAVATPRFINLSAEAEQAVADGTFGALSSTAVTLLATRDASLKAAAEVGAPATSAEIEAATTISGDVALSGDCTGWTITVNGTGYTGPVSGGDYELPAELCSDA